MNAVEHAISAILDNELSVIEHENNSDTCTDVQHISIIGGKRRVEYYPKTGTAFSNSVRGKYESISIKKAGIKRAIKLAKSGN
ncbi:hypothetical protein ACWQEN_001309 [Morganella morganii]|uniref:hypothetical protein n=1 Tax=Morganella morganii TaxID=582 RepID=UPI00164565D5|nr:hypothetical protein [Morganella morganii]MBC3968081.1 hypothetical protein [Morganella morganii]HBN5911650.1 hypothetical protein [Morganella morganii]HBV9098378.1 hypothetical protein [Morganella morganii]HCR3201767.1 hypothetical protein [Morganella morganii]